MRIITWVAVLFAVVSLADEVKPVVSSPAAKSGSLNSSFDEGVFDLQAKTRISDTTKNIDGKERYTAPSENSNTETRMRSIETCKPLQEGNYKDYQDCFAREQARTSDMVEQKIREVEGRQSVKIRNTPVPDSSFENE